MPSVTQLDSGRWRVQWRAADGTRLSAGKSFPTKSAARDYGRDREAEVRAGNGHDVRAGRQTLKAWIAEWEQGRVAEERTRDADRASIDRYILEPVGGGKALGDLRLEQIDEAAIQAWVRRMQQLTGKDDRPLLKASTISRHYQVLAVAVRAAVRARRIPLDPLVNITLPTIPPPDDFFWEPEEIDLIRAELTTPFDRALFELLLGSGARWGEIASLHVNRWQPLKRRMTIATTLVERGGTMLLKEYPKGKTRRDVPIDQDVIEAVAAHLASNPPVDCGLDHGRGKKCPGIVFSHVIERRRRRGQVRPLSRHGWPVYVFAPAIEAADVREGTVHDLRHTYASWLAIDGVPMRLIQQLLGHASIRTTERYGHLAPGALDHPALTASLAKRRPGREPKREPDGTQTG